MHVLARYGAMAHDPIKLGCPTWRETSSWFSVPWSHTNPPPPPPNHHGVGSTRALASAPIGLSSSDSDAEIRSGRKLQGRLKLDARRCFRSSAGHCGALPNNVEHGFSLKWFSEVVARDDDSFPVEDVLRPAMRCATLRPPQCRQRYRLVDHKGREFGRPKMAHKGR